MQYPENTIATLTLKNKTFRAGKDTDSFAEDLNADLIINGEKIGMVSVRNHEPKGFLEPDEPQLVKNVARVLSRWLEKEKAFDHLRMYERVVSNTKDLMSFVSKDYRYLLVNQRYAEMHNKPIDQIQGRLVSEIMGDEVFASTIKPQLDKCFNDKNHISYQESFEMGGDEYTLHVEYDPLIENDEVKGAVVSVRDITELDKARKAIELEARRSEALLDLPLLSEKFGENEFLQKAQEIAESLTQSKISFIHFVNYEETEIELVTWSKRTLEEYCQAAYDKHYPVKQAGIWADAIRQKEPVVFNDYEKFPNKHGLPEGHARLKRMISVPVVEQGKVVMVAGVGNKEHEYVAEDVETVQLICNEIWRIVQRQRYRVELESSVQKRTAELADAMRRMQLAAEATSIGIWEYDVATEELVWDHWMYRIFEFPPDRFHGNLHDLESCLHPDDREYAIKQITNSIKQVVPLDMAFRIITPAGHLRYIQTKAIVRKDQDGAPVKVVGTSLDVSAQYELNENLKMAVKVAESANREKSAFLANMSHEIRTPLNAILGMTYLLMQDSSINTKALAQIKKVESSGKHLLALINDILDLSKIDAGKIELEKVSFNLKELLDNVAFMMHDEAMLKGLKLRVKSRNASCHVLGDPTRLNQVLLNLVGNGIKFTDEGSITINAECTEISEEKLLLHFDVIDTGIGIDKEAQSHLFQAFKQADSSTTRKYGGTGLGLAVCQKLVDEMDGTIGIDSEPGKGSRFWFEIKLDADNEVPVDGSADSKVDGQGEELDKRRKIENIHGASILLVEDDTINQEVAKGLLGKLDASVEIAPNGQEAVNLFLNKQSFDLVLMDIHMPVMDGYQATREIRALENGKNIPILAMTANAFADHKTESYEAGMNDFITKPVEPERLFNKLLEWLPENVFVFDNHQAEESGSAPDIDENQRRKLKDYFLSVDSIDIKRGLLSLNGDIDQYLSLARMFVSQHRQDAGLMESCIVDQVWEDARGIAHKAKGAAGTLGIIKIHSAAESLEKLFKQKTYNPEMPLQLEKFKSAYDELKRLIDQAPKSDAQQLSAPVSMQSVNELLDELKFLLDQGNAKAIDLFELNKAELESVFGDAVQGLQDNIENFDFDSALSDVESLLSVLSQQN
jgi:two-component system sensor histidine kinase/response regulator